MKRSLSKDTCGLRFAGFVGDIFGIVMWINIYVILFHSTEIFKKRCFSNEFGICNGKGYCDERGSCVCTHAFYSGRECKTTQCPGLTPDGHDCSGFGYCGAPEATIKDIPKACREMLPSSDNGFIRSGGWDSDDCVLEIQSRFQQLAQEPDLLFSLPVCQCKNPMAGPTCDTIRCPQNLAFEICSLQGNNTVGFVTNATKSGLGCQCSEDIVYMLNTPILQSFTPPARQRIQDKFLDFYSRPFCGRLREHSTKPDLKLVWTDNPEPYRCYCKERFSGRACEDNVCPQDANGKTCSANGHRAFGMGAETNLPAPIHERCRVMCAPGFYQCPIDERCVPNESFCRASFQKCPSQKPYRCRDGLCVSILEKREGYAYGSLDDPSGAITRCDERTFKNQLFLNSAVRQQVIQKCVGSLGNLTENQRAFKLGGVIPFDSPLLYVAIKQQEGASVKFQWRNEILESKEQTAYWVLHTSYLEFEKHRFEQTARVQVVQRNDQVDIWPAPFLFDSGSLFPDEWSTFRIQSNRGRVVVVDSIQSRMEFLPQGLWFIVNVTNPGMVLRPYGSIVSLDDCLSDIRACIWSVETRKSVDGQRIFCKGASSPNLVGCSADATFNPNRYLRVDTVLTAKVRVGWTSSLEMEDDEEWFLEKGVPLTTKEYHPDELVVLESTGEIEWVEFIQLKDMIAPSICPLSIVNASTLNEKWFHEPDRPLPVETGEDVVAMLELFGNTRLVRGKVVSIQPNPMVQVNGFDLPIDVVKWKRITRMEAKRGVPGDDFAVFPSICPNGDSSKLSLEQFPTSTVDCECQQSLVDGLMCTCWTPFVNKKGITCTCEWDGSGCVCEGSNRPMELEISRLVMPRMDQTCYLDVDQVSPEGREVPVSFNLNTSIATFSRMDGAFLMEIYFGWECDGNDQPINQTLELWGRWSLFSDIWEQVQFESKCMNNGTSLVIRPIFADNKDVYNEWQLKQVNNTNLTLGLARYSPRGIPIPIQQIDVSTNDELKENILWNDFDYWESSVLDQKPHLALFFPSPQLVVGVFFVWRTVGLDLGEGNSYPVEIELQETVDGGNHWVNVQAISSNVSNGYQVQYIPMEHQPKVNGLRIRSYYPLAIRQMIPLTNQDCSFGYLDAVDTTTTNLFSQSGLRSILLQESRLNTSLECKCENTCMIHGVNVSTAASECMEERYVRDHLKLKMQQEVQIGAGLSGLELVQSIYGENVTKSFFFRDASLFVWWWEPNSTNETVAHPSLIAFPTEPVSVGGEALETFGKYYVYYRGNGNFTVGNSIYAIQPENGGRILFYENKTLLELGKICAPGTQCIPCGPSNALAPADPGLVCTRPDWQNRLMDDWKNRSATMVDHSYLLRDLIESAGVTIRMNLTWTLAVTKVWKKHCVGACYFSCLDGSCSDSPTTCPPPRFQCDGDGCVKSSIQTNHYDCVCGLGTGGLQCSATTCVPPDPATGLVDPHLICSCGGPPRLKIQPPFTGAVPQNRCYTKEQLRAINRQGKPPRSPMDVRDRKVMPNFAPYGKAVYRCYEEGKRQFWTTCPFLKEGPFGEKLSLEDSVAVRNPVTGEVEAWKNFTTATGEVESYSWRGDEYRYDDFPYPCANGDCVRTAKDCFQSLLEKPLCNRHGECMVDGTCTCEAGRETFVYTPEFTTKVAIPYPVENPVNWGGVRVLGETFRDHCLARNCSSPGVNCGIPYGCFKGTKERRFMDAHVQCRADSRHEGKCALDFAACKRGDVTNPIACPGGGIPRLRDYRQHEWYCECGDPVSRLVDPTNMVESRTITELVPNGRGGDACEFYDCQADTRIKVWTQRNRLTGLPFLDNQGVTLPGKWTGSCGAHIGPRPEDEELWTRDCCPGLDRLDRCNRVLCKIADVLTCVDPRECTGEERHPQVFPCNGHGNPLSDGSCECERNDETGMGYGADNRRFSGEDNCFKRISCPVASNGNVCNAGGEYRLDWPEFPKVDYWEDQIWSLLIHLGIAPTKTNAVRYLFSTIHRREQLVRAAFVQTALEVMQDIAGAASDICVLSPNEDPANPLGMLTYVGKESIVGPYGKAFTYPYELILPPQVTNGSLRILFDRRFFKFLGNYENLLKEGVDYLLMKNSPFPLIDLSLGKRVKISGIRIFAKTRSKNAVFLTFLDKNKPIANPLCNKLKIENDGKFEWRGSFSNMIHYCIKEWKELDFRAEYKDDWLMKCKEDEESFTCREWKDQVCSKIPGTKIRETGSLDHDLGCSNSRCCIPLTKDFESTDSLRIFVSTEADGNEKPSSFEVEIQELVLFGYGDTIISPPPKGLMDELVFKTGIEKSKCLEETNMRRLLEENGAYYPYRNYSNRANMAVAASLDYNQSLLVCQESGGKMATSRGAEDVSNYALFYGQACFENQAATSTGKQCLVGARNLNEPTQPVTADFFLEDCSRFGCYLCPTEGLVGEQVCMKDNPSDHISDPTNGSQWQSAWAGENHKPWSAYLDTTFMESERQVQMIPDGVFGIRIQYAPWLRYMRTDNGNPIQYPLQKSTDSVYCLFEGKSLVSVRSLPYFEPLLPEKPFSRKQTRRGIKKPVDVGGSVVEMWTDTSTCRVSLWNEMLCGQYGFASSDNGKARKDFWVTPGDDFDKLFTDLLKDPVSYDRCGKQFSVGCNARGYGTVQSGAQSISVSGPCSATVRFELRGQVYDHTFDENSATSLFDLERKAGIGYLNPGDSQRDYVEFIPGCVAQCVRTFWCDGSTVGDRWKVRSFIPDYAPSNLRGKEFFMDGMTISSLKINPKFTSHKVQVKVRAPEQSTNNGEHDFVMGWREYPFMCSRVELRVLKTVGPGKDLRVRGDADVNRLAGISRTLVKTPSVTQTVTNPWIGTYTVTTEGTFTLTTAMIDNLLKESPVDTTPFVPCQVTKPKRMINNCQKCVKEQPIGEWEWDQRAFNPQRAAFPTVLSSLRQTFVNQLPAAPRPEAHVTWTSSSIQGQTRRFDRLSTLLTRFPKTYARQVAQLRLPLDWRVRFFLDNCVAVKETGLGTIPYHFETAICDNPNYVALCMRDYIAYTAQCGRMCDVCGNCGKKTGGVPNPPATVFTAFPRAVRSNFPSDHEKMDKFLDGTLDEAIKEGYGLNEYDVLYDYIRQNHTQSVVIAFPEFRKAIQGDISDRPGRESLGIKSNPRSWLDAYVNRAFPIHCGLRCSKKTGICRKRIALDWKYCDPDAPQLPQTAIPDNQLPLDWKGVPSDVDASLVKQCTIQVDPNSFFVRDGFGAPSKRTDFVVLESTPGESILLRKVVDTTVATWSNTGKNAHGTLFKNGTRYRGSFYCSRPGCSVSIWLSNLNPFYDDPIQKIILGQTTVSPFDFFFDGNQTALQILGWDIQGLAKGDTVKLSIALISDQHTLTACQRPVNVTMYELPSSIDTAESKHICVFDKRQGGTVGECLCEGSAFGGKTCESPQTNTAEKGKRICSGWGHPGRCTISPYGTVVSVDGDGVWMDQGSVGCKCLNPGLVLRTRRVPATAFDHLYVYESEKVIQEDEFMTITTFSEDIDFPISGEEIEKVCGSESAVLPSMATGDEAIAFSKLVAGRPTFMDLIRDSTGDFRWKSRNAVTIRCRGEQECGERLDVNPCVTNPEGGLCKAIHFNNWVFQSTGNGLTDGSLEQTLTIRAGVELMVNSRVPEGSIVVEVRVASADPPILQKILLVRTNTGTVCSVARQGETRFFCRPSAGDPPRIQSISIGRGGGGLFGTVTIAEVLVYAEKDTTRFPGFF